MIALPRQTARLGLGPKVSFGIGQIAEGIHMAALALLLLFFYSQTLGLSPFVVGLILSLGLVVDAVTDPLIGSISDSLRHRWGRRHPFMYLSAVPLGVSFALLFSPPAGMGHAGLYLWLVTFALGTRLAMTLYHVPHLALGAELSVDRHERTVIVAYRTFFALVGVAMVTLLNRLVFLAPTPEFPNGQLNATAYPRMGVVFALAMTASVLLSARGTHSMIPHLPRAPEHAGRFSFRRMAREFRETLDNHSFRFFAMAAVAYYIARGTHANLDLHMGTYFWELGSDAVLLPIFGNLAVIPGTPLWTWVSKKLDKRETMLLGLWLLVVASTLPPLLKMAGLFPDPASALYRPLVYASGFTASLGGLAAMIMMGSMLADVADEHELQTGRRQEGVFFGVLAFAGKTAVSIGSLAAGSVLSLIEFPLQAEPEAVPLATVNALAWAAGPGSMLFALLAIYWVGKYSIDRERHAEIRLALGAHGGGS